MSRLLLATLITSTLISTATAAEVDFNRDVRPILAARCFACHGPDKSTREAELRLDQRQAALESEAFVPSQPDESELVRRIQSNDPDLRMPPPDAGPALTAEQQDTLTRWIAAGATYDTHWAFVPPRKAPLPNVKQSMWVRNEIDHFILHRLQANDFAPASEADKLTLVRRLYLDLLGVPPTPAEADAFVDDQDAKAYERLVDRLLESPQYGERWARLWLDLAPYSDTNGYEKDRNRSIWPFRDWVIRALNDDMPFDQFTIEQLAGDMLPNATEAGPRIATGFHRNTMLNEEGGIDPLEYRFYAMVDRVATTGIVWLGMTTGCAQCHSHKYDPVSHTDYYRLLALLNNADEPDLRVRTNDLLRQEQQLLTRISKLEADLANQFPPAAGDGSLEARRKAHLATRSAAWITKQESLATAWQTITPHALSSNLPKLEVLADGSIFSSGDITKRDRFTLRFQDLPSEPVTALRLEALPDVRLPAGGPGRTFYEGRKGDFFLSEMNASLNGQPLTFARGSHSYGKISIGSGKAAAANVYDGEGSTGWSTSGNEGKPAQLVLNFAKPTRLEGELVVEMLFERHFAASLGRFRLALTSSVQEVNASPLSAEVEAILAKDAASRTAEEQQRLLHAFLTTAAETAEARKAIDALRKQLPTYPSTMVLQERPADNLRATHRHHRGEFLSPREPVTPGVPAVFAHLTETQPSNRLELARWLVSPENPLVARVTVNRAWRAFFGTGIMRTRGDFGTQSEPPTHAELLDWLAVDFMEHGWSLKRLHKKLVMSAAYRQNSSRTSATAKRDPNNRMYGRGPRHRLDAEMIRDTLLKSSGLLSAKMYGPSVFPPQPAAVTSLAYGGTPWKVSPGEDRFRRSLYTFNKRTAPFAAYTVFDGPTGENCIARRDRSNTPLQALTLLNDAMFVELARAAARRLPADVAPELGVRTLFRMFLTRPPSEAELTLIVAYQQRQRARLEAGELDATKIAQERDAKDLAAWTLVARALMNLDEVITKH